jgi:glycosyltransferase involved in cell wall biosynthesis
MTESHGRTRDSEEVRHNPRAPQRERGADKPLVSVVIPCYNQAHFLGEAIESVLSQTYPHFEIIVVDDGSTDNTSEVASDHQKVRLIRQENQGLSAARNAGLYQSRGEYIVFLDADDRLLPEALEVGVKELGAHPKCAFVFGYHNNIATDGSPLATSHPPHNEPDQYLALLHRCYIRMHAVMYRRSVFETVGGFDTSLGASEDYDMYLRIAREYPVYHHDEVVAEYRRRHGANMTGNPALILGTSVSVHRSQRKHIKGNKQYREAYKAGLRRRQWTHGDRLVGEVRARAREHEWKRALGGALILLRYYPRGLPLLLLSERRMERRRPARRLEALVRELEVREGRLKESEGTQEEEESGSALARERHEVQLLRKRIRRLERRIQNLDQQP